MNRLTKCRLVGYSFLTFVTLVEIVMFCTMFHVDVTHWSKAAAVVLAPITFNISVWIVAILYYKVRQKKLSQ